MTHVPSRDKRSLLAVFIVLLVIFETIAYVATTPKPREQFLQIYVLGPNHVAGEYYPYNSTDIRLGEVVKWYLGVTDSMGTVQLVEVRVKIGNQTIESPDDMKALDSPAPVVTEFRRFMQDNETWEMPFVWSVSDATSFTGSTRILKLQVNNETYQIQDCSASNGHNFRLILELWTWQTETNGFEFGWTTNGEHRVAWLQMWFNMTRPVSV